MIAHAVFLVEDSSLTAVESEYVKSTVLVGDAAVELAAVIFFSKESLFLAIVGLVFGSLDHILRRGCRLGVASLLITLVVFLVCRCWLGVASLLIVLAALLIRGCRLGVALGFRLGSGLVVSRQRATLGGANGLGLRLGARDLSGMTGSFNGPRMITGGDFSIVNGSVTTMELEGSVTL